MDSVPSRSVGGSISDEKTRTRENVLVCLRMEARDGGGRGGSHRLRRLWWRGGSASRSSWRSRRSRTRCPGVALRRRGMEGGLARRGSPRRRGEALPVMVALVVCPGPRGNSSSPWLAPEMGLYFTR